jgi:hypothetical protein
MVARASTATPDISGPAHRDRGRRLSQPCEEDDDDEEEEEENFDDVSDSDN